MRNRKRTDARARANDDARAPGSGSSSTLLQQLLRKLQGVQDPPAEGGKPLPPAGRRSGKGAESLAPYLDEARNSRPGPLE